MRTTFSDIVNELSELHARKASDYGSDEDPLANIRACRDFGIEPWVGALLRLNDKVYRLKRFAVRGTLQNESAEDSLRDIAVYAIIALGLLRERSRERSNEIKATLVPFGEVGK